MTTLASVVSWTLSAYGFLILIRVVLSYINTNPYNPRIDHPIVRLLYRVTDLVLSPLRRIIPPIGGTIDISPIIALFIVEIVRRILVSLLLSF